MKSIFKKNRRNITSKYLKYAIGEIVLVMIGILLAMQINNWNENRKQQREFNNILNTIHQDLKRDTLIASSLIKYYKEIEKNSLHIINKKVNRNNYKEYPKSKNLVSRYKSFNIQTKGFSMAKNFSTKNVIKNDSLFIEISQFYSAFLPIIDDSNGFVKEEVLSNIETYKKYDWYVDWTQGNFTDDMILYFSESEEYRKQVASHNLLAGKNHMLFISAYYDNAIKVMKLINENLSNK